MSNINPERKKMHPNKRKKHESYAAYKDRLRTERKAEKIRAKGILVWDSKHRGTYIKAKHGPLV